MLAYKIFDITNDGTLKMLFHGIQNVRVVPLNRWIKAEKRWAGEGGNKYWTGFHVFKKKESCIKYKKKFTDQSKTRVIVKCYAKKLRPKESSGGHVFLADELFVPINFKKEIINNK